MHALCYSGRDWCRHGTGVMLYPVTHRRFESIGNNLTCFSFLSFVSLSIPCITSLCCIVFVVYDLCPAAGTSDRLKTTKGSLFIWMIYMYFVIWFSDHHLAAFMFFVLERCGVWGCTSYKCTSTSLFIFSQAKSPAGCWPNRSISHKSCPATAVATLC